MNPSVPIPWVDANQQALVREVARVRGLLESWLARRSSGDTPREPTPPVESELPSALTQAGPTPIPPTPPIPPAPTPARSGKKKSKAKDGSSQLQSPDPEALPAATPSSSALESLCAAFGLSRFERDLILLCAAPDLDARFLSLVAQAHGDARRTTPTFSLALAALPDAHWSALLPTAPLRRWRLIEVGGGDAITQCALRIDEWLLHFLAGVPYLDDRLQPLVRTVRRAIHLSESQRHRMARILAFARTHPPAQPWPFIEIIGDSPDDQIAVAEAACAALGLRLFQLSAADTPAGIAERDAIARLWEREAALCGSALLVDLHEPESAEATLAAVALIESITSVTVVLTREPLRGLNRANWKMEVPRPSAREQRDLWRAALGPQARDLNGELEAIVGQFRLTAREIRESSLAYAATLVPSSSPATSRAPSRPPVAETLWSLCRARCRTRLESLAQRIDPAATWDDLILPETQRRVLREMAAQVRQRFRVHEEWGFAEKGTRGLGISALFAGPSGTGKTMAAEVLANELRIDLFRIDLSAVVSKYIGETEKNLRRVFDAAESGSAVLLFDEADALFGKRSEVKDSHDRYANIEVGYLLQRIETYRGLAILTTNFRQALDTAFLRRLRFVVQFPFPDTAQRAEIWRKVFPAATPTEGLDNARLARLNVTGGNIRSIALNAAFLAAETPEPIKMKHLLQAARTECAKLERPPSEAELGGWNQ